MDTHTAVVEQPAQEEAPATDPVAELPAEESSEPASFADALETALENLNTEPKEEESTPKEQVEATEPATEEFKETDAD
jgi:hypothetical protein